MIGIWTAIALIIAGTLIWLANLGVLSWNWGRDWPWILVALGIIGLVGEIARRIRPCREKKANGEKGQQGRDPERP